MRPKENIKQIIKEFDIDANPQKDQQIFDKLKEVYAKSQKSKYEISNLDIGRIIMKNKMTKFATVATIILIVLFSITFLDKSVTPAYAIEQTIEAFKNVKFLHIVRYDELGDIADERWIEINADGSQGRYHQDTKGILLVVDDGTNRFVYHRDKNAVLLYGNDGPKYTWISNLHKFFGDLAGDSSVTIEENVNYNGQKAHLVRWLNLNVECYIDPETKLPIALGRDRIFYEQPPINVFDIPKIPKTATVVDKRTTDKNEKEPDWVKNQELAQETFKEARIALANDKYAESIKLFKEVFQLEGTGRNWAWFWLGQAYYKMGQYDSAIEAYSKVIDMFAKYNMTSYEAHYARGLAFRSKNNEDAAWNDFAIALPVMIDSLRNTQGTRMFDYADDPLEKGKGLTEEQRFNKMIMRLHKIAHNNIEESVNSTKEGIIASWEKWWDNINTE